MRQKGHAITPVWEKQQLSDREEIWSCLCFMQWFLNTKWLCSPGREIRIQVPMLSIAAVIPALYFPHVPGCSPVPVQRVALVTAQWLPKAFWHAFTASWSHLDKHPSSSSTLLAGLRPSGFHALICLIRQGLEDNTPGLRCTHSLHISRCQSAFLDPIPSPASAPAPHVHLQITAPPCLSAVLRKPKDYKWLDLEAQVQWHKSKLNLYIHLTFQKG